MSDSRAADDSYLFLPLDPRQQFVAVTNSETEQRIKLFPPEKLVDETNRFIVLQASRYVYGADSKAI